MNIVPRNVASSLSRAVRAPVPAECRVARARALATALAGALAGCACGAVLVAGAPRVGRVAASEIVPMGGRSDVSRRAPEAGPRSVSMVVAPAIDAGATATPDPEQTSP
jgi:hypothetical protein